MTCYSHVLAVSKTGEQRVARTRASGAMDVQHITTPANGTWSLTGGRISTRILFETKLVIYQARSPFGRSIGFSIVVVVGRIGFFATRHAPRKVGLDEVTCVDELE
jgi:hypothetical protein